MIPEPGILGVGAGGVRRQVTGQARQALLGGGELLVKECRWEELVETALSPLERQHLGGVWAVALCGGGLGFQGGRSGHLVWLAEVAGSILVNVSMCFPK